MNEDTGGPAFPQPVVRQLFTVGECGGMPLRDYFAAKAMQGLIAQSDGSALRSDCKVGAEYAYEMADAMLEERAK